MWKFYKINIARLIVLTAISAIVASILGYSASSLDETSLFVTILALVATLLALSSSLYRYLFKDEDNEKVKQTTIVSEKADLNPGNDDPTKAKSNASEGDGIIVESTYPKSERIKASATYSYKDDVALKRGDTLRFFSSSELRIKKEIRRLNKDAMVNLYVGVLIAIIGVAGLFWYIIQYTDNESGEDVALLIVHWVTRLSLISIVEVFAFFFLKMYRTHLQSIRYFQDELTSIESRKIAMLSSVIHENPEDISKSIECLLNIDRNFKMETSQTTVDLEKLKTENNFIKSQMDSMLEMFKGVLSFNQKKE
ncbi:hypothetical protein [Xylanibacter brevis]|uniref:hypothetical protein n=1 Tax=Xylanibacter brevis TaxID=83231 RepID=UPI000483A4E6|nr:hypothetical protein [Xylanibacter brevis]